MLRQWDCVLSVNPLVFLHLLHSSPLNVVCSDVHNDGLICSHDLVVDSNIALNSICEPRLANVSFDTDEITCEQALCKFPDNGLAFATCSCQRILDKCELCGVTKAPKLTEREAEPAVGNGLVVAQADEPRWRWRLKGAGTGAEKSNNALSLIGVRQLRHIEVFEGRDVT